MRMRPSFSLLLFLASLAHAQTRSAPAPEPAASSFGAVFGHITVSNSNSPARFAKVALQPIEIKPEVTDPKAPVVTFRIYQEVRRDAPVDEPAFGFGPPGKETVVQQYGPGELPVTLTGDKQGANIPVQAAPAKMR